MRPAVAMLLGCLGAAAPGQAVPAAEGGVPIPVERIRSVLAGLDDAAGRADVAACLSHFVPDHPGAHAMLGVHLARVLSLGKQPRRQTRILGGPHVLGPRTLVHVEHELHFDDPALPVGFRVREQALLAFRADGARVVPTFAVVLPTLADDAMRTAPLRQFRCQVCNYEVLGAPSWFCVPMREEGAQALEGATFHLAGTDVACDVSVRVADQDGTALDTAQRLAGALCGIEPDGRAAVPTAWVPPALADEATTGGCGARVEVALRGGARAVLHVVRFGGLEHVLLVRGDAATLRRHAADVERLLAGYRLLEPGCDPAARTAASLHHHTGGRLVGNRYENPERGIALTGPDGWRAEQRAGGAAFRVVWTSPAGSRLWFVGYAVPRGLDRWTAATADRWIEKLLEGAGLVATGGPDADWEACSTLDLPSRTLVARPQPGLDPTRPFERRLRAILRDDLLVVADARAQTAEDEATLATALRAIAPLR